MENKITKVLFCSPSGSNKGGITIWAKNIIDYFSDNNNNNDIEFIHFKMDRSVDLTHLLPFHKRMYYALKDYGTFPIKLYKTLVKNKITVAHIATIGGWMGSIRDIVFVLICKHCKVKSIIHYHCGTIPKFSTQNNLKWKIQNIAIKKANKVIVLDEQSKIALNHLGYTHIYKIPNPIPIELSKKLTQNNRINNSLLFVGHVVPTKGIFEFLTAVKDITNIKVNIFGPRNNDIDNEINNILNKNDFKCEIKFWGLQPSNIIYDYMRKSTIFVLPTYSEGFPLAIMEAMACGCPIITTPVGAIKEMLSFNNEITGYLVPVKDSTALHEMINYCLNHKTEIYDKAAKAQEKVYSTYTLEKVIEQLKHIWKS